MLPVYEDVLVEAWIDEQGKISSYQILNAPPDTVEKISAARRRRSADDHLRAATRFGQPQGRRHAPCAALLRRITIRAW